MIHSKVSKRKILVSLLFLILMSQIINISGVTDIEFSDEKQEVFGHSRVLFGYNASLLVKEWDVSLIFWVILEDKGDYDVVWNTTRVDYDIKDLETYKENKSSVLLEKGVKNERTMLIKTAYVNLTEKNLHLKIKFSFIEYYNNDNTTKYYYFRKNWINFLNNRIDEELIPTIAVGLIVGGLALGVLYFLYKQIFS